MHSCRAPLNSYAVATSGRLPDAVRISLGAAPARRLGGRVHPQIAWTKLETLAQGAALASRQLW
jgi:hypothetical protein